MVEHIRLQPPSDHRKLLVSFAAGIASHMVADATWHSIRLDEGLLRVMAEFDFDGSFGAAHKVLDPGGDLVYAWRLGANGLDWIEDSWQVPLDDLVEVYARLNQTISKTTLRYCTLRGLAVLRATKKFGSNLYPRFAAQSSWMVDFLDSYHLGGVDEMVSSTVECWQGFQEWLRDGVHDPWSYCPLLTMVRSNPPAPELTGSSSSTFSCRHAPVDDLLNATVEQEMQHLVAYEKDGMLIVSAGNKEEIAKQHTFKARESDTSRDVGDVGASKWLSARVPGSKFGTSLAIGNFTGDMAIAVGAPLLSENPRYPHRGGVYILPSSLLSVASSHKSDFLQLQTSSLDAAIDARWTAGGGRFGAAMTTLQIGNVSVLAVASPGRNIVELFVPSTTTAAVVTILGPSKGGFGEVLQKAHDGNLLISAPFAKVGQKLQAGEIYYITEEEILAAMRGLHNIYPQPRIRGRHAFGWLGASMDVLDDDFIVGGPGPGVVYVHTMDHDLQPHGRAIYRTPGFGGSVAVGKTNGRTWFAVGNHRALVNGIEQGAVYFFTDEIPPIEIVSAEAEEFGKFGMHLWHSAAGDELMISSPLANALGGRIWKVDTHALHGDRHVVAAAMQGGEEKAGLGASYVEMAGMAIIGLPYAGFVQTENQVRLVGAISSVNKTETYL